MRIYELFAGHPLLEINSDDAGLGSSTPLAAMAAPGITSVDQEFALSRLKPLRRLRHLKRGALTGSDSTQP
jgi:hypothetical protein